MSPALSDSDLIVGFLEGRPDEVAILCGWIRMALSSFRTHLSEELEDVEQECLLDLTRALREGRYRRQSSLRTYIRSYVHHKCIDRLRASRRRQWVSVDQLAQTPSRAPSAFEAMTRTETANVGLRVFADMPETCRELWRMLENGLSYREMSRRLGVGEGALRARVLRCRRRALELRARLTGSGNTGREPGPGSG